MGEIVCLFSQSDTINGDELWIGEMLIDIVFMSPVEKIKIKPFRYRNK